MSHNRQYLYRQQNKNNRRYPYQQQYENSEWHQYPQYTENSGLNTYSQQNESRFSQQNESSFSQQNESSKRTYQQQVQRQEVVTAYDRQVTYEIFYDTMEFLEKYIEIAGYFPDWHARRQFPNNEVKRTIDGPEDAEECFSIVLLGLKNTIKHKPPFIQEEIKQEFYRWISTTKINEYNCPERLQHILFGFNEILEGRSEKFDKDLKNSKQTLDPNSPEYAKELTKTFISVQAPLQNQRDIAESLAGKKHDEINIENRFNGIVEHGQGILNKISSTVSGVHENFYFFPQEDRKKRIVSDMPPKNKLTGSDDVDMIS